MDPKTVDPKIAVREISIVEMSFSRQPATPEDSRKRQLEIVFEHKSQFNESENELTTILSFKISTTDKFFNVEGTMVGWFAQHGEGVLSLREFSEVNALAIMYPYLRQAVTATLAFAGVRQFYLPPMNIAALVKDKKATSDEPLILQVSDASS